MKSRLLDVLVCPKCKGGFSLREDSVEFIKYSLEAKAVAMAYLMHFESDESKLKTLWRKYETNILTGSLSCGNCRVTYPIENGIPRILPIELRTQLNRMGRGDPMADQRLVEFDDEAPPIPVDDKKFNEVQLANQSNYGYQWKAFSHEYAQWDELYRERYVQAEDDFFRFKLGLDAGCGMARYSIPPTERGAEMVGLDLSNAIERAYEKSLKTPLLHAVQGDIFNLPFRDNFFDFAQSLGVIHITPNPEVALLSIQRVVKERGRLFLYVYRDFKEHDYLKHLVLQVVKQTRRIAVKLPSNFLYGLLYLMVPFVLVLDYFPSWLCWHLGLRDLSERFFYNYRQYGNRHIKDIHMNLFDRFGNPVERRYTKAEMNEWMQKVGFESYDLRLADGWSVSALKAENRTSASNTASA